MTAVRRDTWYIVGHGQLPSDIPAYQLYKILVVGLEVEPATGLIVDAYCTLATPPARRVARSAMLGRRIPEDLPEVVRELEERFHGSSQRAIIFAFKEAVKKFVSLKQGS